MAVARDGLPAAQLTTVGLNGLTGWRALDELSPAEGETLVIAGAGGSVGGFARELAADMGIRVIAAVPEGDGEYVLGLGASEVAARETGNVASTVRGDRSRRGRCLARYHPVAGENRAWSAQGRRPVRDHDRSA